MNRILILIFIVLLSIIVIEAGYLIVIKTPTISTKQLISELTRYTPRYTTVKISDKIVRVGSKGVIAGISILDKVTVQPKTGIVYDVLIAVRVGDKNNYFYYMKQELSDSKKTTIKDGDKTIPFNNLKVGDLISIQEVIDLTKKLNDSSIEVKIIKNPT